MMIDELRNMFAGREFDMPGAIVFVRESIVTLGQMSGERFDEKTLEMIMGKIMNDPPVPYDLESLIDALKRVIGELTQGGGDEGPKSGLPDLSRYIPRISEAFTNYIETTLPEMGPQMTVERVQGIAYMVEDMLHESPPNMVGILGLAKEIGLEGEMAEKMMADIKNYMNSLIMEILESMEMSQQDRERAVQGMAYAFESLTNEEYMMTMGSAFGGSGDLGAVEDFLDATFELPDLSEVSFRIFDEVTKYM